MIKTELNFCLLLIVMLFHFNPFQIAMAEDDKLIIDDRRSGNYFATSGDQWRLVTDGVMGGVSDGQLSVDRENQNCLRLQGDVKLDNNGGFVQAALDLSTYSPQDIEKYAGLMLTVYGNNEQYNVHLRTRDNWLPWQAYRATFTAAPEWKELYIPFTEFVPYRTDKALDVSRLKRIGIVAIGREFRADLCIGRIVFYR